MFYFSHFLPGKPELSRHFCMMLRKILVIQGSQGDQQPRSEKNILCHPDCFASCVLFYDLIYKILNCCIKSSNSLWVRLFFFLKPIEELDFCCFQLLLLSFPLVSWSHPPCSVTTGTPWEAGSCWWYRLCQWKKTIFLRGRIFLQIPWGKKFPLLKITNPFFFSGRTKHRLL